MTHGPMYPPRRRGNHAERAMATSDHSPAGEQPRLGLYGGSFDPPHKGHAHVLRTAMEAGRLQRCLVVPAARSPFKRSGPVVGDAVRLELLRAAFGGWPGVEIDERELRRPPPSFTIDTVRELARETGAQVVLVLGSDNLPDLPRWREGAELLALVEPLVVHRGGDAEEHLARACAGLAPQLAAKLRAGYVRRPEVVASSSDLRARLDARDASALAELPEAVARLVLERGLYGWAAR